MRWRSLAVECLSDGQSPFRFKIQMEILLKGVNDHALFVGFTAVLQKLVADLTTKE